MFWGFQTFSFYRLVILSIQIQHTDILANSQITSKKMKKNTPFQVTLSPITDSPVFWLLSLLPLLLHPLKWFWNTLAKFISEDLQLSNPNYFFSDFNLHELSVAFETPGHSSLGVSDTPLTWFSSITTVRTGRKKNACESYFRVKIDKEQCLVIRGDSDNFLHGWLLKQDRENGSKRKENSKGLEMVNTNLWLQLSTTEKIPNLREWED